MVEQSMPRGPVTQIALITIALSDYENENEVENEFKNLPATKEDAQTMHDYFSKMGIPEDRIFHLENPDEEKFLAAIGKVKLLAKNGERTQLFLHYAGHG
jgi:hypothetical protein